jgi:integrase
LASNTIHGCYTLLRSALDQPFQDGIIDRNPAASVRPPKTAATQRDAPTVESFEALLSACEDTRWYALFLMLGTAGMRVSEALALRWQDVTGEVATIRYSLARAAGAEPALGSTKTGLVHDVILTPLAVDALDRHRLLQVKAQLKSEVWVDLGLIFPDTRGDFMQRTAVNQALNQGLAKAGIAHFRVHDLRHMCATLLLESGMAPHAVAEQLGHRSPSTTMTRYAHVTAKQRREGADRMDAILTRERA